MRSLNILFTNNTLDARAGTELWVRDMALALEARGHVISAYSPLLGSVAAEMRAAGIDVVDDIERVQFRPDVIHGHHHLETMTAVVRYSDVPALYVCHGAVPWEEEPPLHPNIRRWVAVDELTRERVSAAGVPPDRIAVLHNFVDTARFLPRGPLPARPRRALVFSNQIEKSNGFRAIARACAKEGISVELAGLASGRVLDEPEKVLREFDLVFAKGRAALEAMASGCAVVLCDAKGLGPYILLDDLAGLRQFNFGMRTLTVPLSTSNVRDRIAAYDAADAAQVTAWIRERASIACVVDRLEDIYGVCIAEGVPDDPVERSRATARYLASVALRVKHHEGIRRQRDVLAARMRVLTAVGRLRFWRRDGRR